VTKATAAQSKGGSKKDSNTSATPSFEQAAPPGKLYVATQVFVAQPPPKLAGSNAAGAAKDVAGATGMFDASFPSVSADSHSLEAHTLRRSLLENLAPALPFPYLEGFPMPAAAAQSASNDADGDSEGEGVSPEEAAAEALESRPTVTVASFAHELPLAIHHLSAGEHYAV
jgi:hypothetical protein